MDDLTHYIFGYYPHLMTETEHAAWMAIIIETKAAHAGSPASAAQMRAEWPELLPRLRQRRRSCATGWRRFKGGVRAGAARVH